MIHIVNPQTSEILDYITLDNIIDDTHKKSLESYIETYDAIVLGGEDFSYDKHLEKRNHIIIPDEDGTYQEFILFEVDKYRDTEGRKTHFYAHATYLELKKAKVIYPARREGFTLSQHAGWALNDTGWTVGIVESEGVRTFNIENHTNPYEFIKRIANEFEVELRFRVEHDGRRITARYVDFLERIGDWKGREVEFGRDLDSIRRIEKQDVVTALLGLGPEREDGTRLEVLVEDEEALLRWGRVDEHGNLHHLIEPYEIQSDRQEMTEEEARQYTRTALDKRINTQVTYETTILDLEEVPGLEHEKIRFGDTIRIKDTHFNPPLYLEARVYEIERSIKSKAKKDIKLGDYIEYTEEEVNAIWNQLRNEIIRRMNRLAIVSITSTAGNVFKNAQGTTELTARTFVSGAERDEDGTLYDYQWMRFDKDGNHDTDFYAEGKTITVTANDIDEKATYRVLVAYELEVISTAEITISNVFDGEDGEPGPPGPKGDKGDPGPQGPPGTSVTSIVEYYLATDQNSGVTTSTPGWTTTIQQMTPQNRYLWNYERINFSDGTHQNTNPVIIGVYGDEGEEGRSVVDITEYYLASSASSGVTRSTPGWTTTMQVTTPEQKYLWNYEKITWNKAPLETYTDPVIIGVHGEKGEDGKTFYTWIKYADTPTSGMSDSPEGKEYIGIAYNKETPTPSTNYSDYTWSKFKGEQGVPGPPGEDGQPTYTWVKYADDEHGNGMSDSPDGKLYIGLAFNKTTPEESNNPADYTWSLMPQNIEIGGRNLLKGTSDEWTILQLSDSQYYFQQGTDTRLEIGETYTFSILVEKVSDDDVPISVNIGTGTKGTFLRDKGSRIPVEFGKRFTLTFTITENDIANGYEYFAWRLRNERQTTTIRFKEVQLEKGNKATDWTPAPEDVQEQIDEAKQEAEEAKQTAQQAQTTADGKNSVFTQPTQPSTTGRKIGDIWFDTSRDNLMHRFDGTKWVEAKWGEQSIVANSITANHIKSLAGLNVNDQFIVDSNGNVKFGGSLEGASGTFGNVSVKDGDFIMADSVTGASYSVVTKTNLIKDHSFETLQPTGNVGSDNLFAVGNAGEWIKTGTPKLTTNEGRESGNTEAIYGNQAVVVNNANYVETIMSYMKMTHGVVHTISLYAKKPQAYTAGIPRIYLYVYNEDIGGSKTVLWSTTLTANSAPPSDYRPARYIFNFTMPNITSGVDTYTTFAVRVLSANSNWVIVDGIQLVEGSMAGPYDAENSFFDFMNGYLPVRRLNSTGEIIARGWVYTDAIDSNPYSAGVHLYVRPQQGGELRATVTGTTNQWVDIRGRFVYANSLDVNTGTHVYARPSSSGNLRVTSTGTTSDWRPVEAGGFENRSQEELKQDIELWTESALDIINQAKIYQYRLKTDVANGIDKLKYSVVIGEGYDTPEQFLSASGESVDVYVQTNINTKAIQELDSKFTNLEDKVNLLELENQYLKQKIAELEAKLS